MTQSRSNRPRTLRYIARLSAVMLPSAMAITLTGSAVYAADEPGRDSPREITDSIAAVAPYQDSVISVPIEDGEAEKTFGEVKVRVPIDPKSPISLGTIEDPESTLTITLPTQVDVSLAKATDDGTLVYSATDDGSAIGVQIIDDGSVQIQTVIPDADAPTRYTYKIELPAGSSARTENDGSVSFINSGGVWLGGATAPRAKDADGDDVPTWFTVTSKGLTQVVDTSNVTLFPVVTAPHLGITMISKITYSKSKQGTTVHVSPSIWGRAHGINRTTVNSFKSEYKAKVSSEHNTTQMIWQLNCHAQFAPSKTSWNLDSWIHRESYMQYIINRCN